MPSSPALEEFTPQPYKPINRMPSPIGLDLELLKQKKTPEGPVAGSPECPSFRGSPGRDSAALGPAPQGYTVDVFIHSSGLVAHIRRGYPLTV